MKILHILQSNRISGAENVVADICMMFEGEIEMAYCSPDGPIAKSLYDRNVKFIPIKKIGYFSIRKAINNFQPDIIHAHDVTATVIAAITCMGIPFISHLHVNSENMRKFGLKSFAYFWAVRKSRKIIAVSNSCIKEYIFRARISSKALVLENVIHEKRVNQLISLDLSEYYFDFLYVGRITYQKDPARVARVASEVLKLLPESRFGVVGEGELINEMINVFTEEDVLDRVTFTGRLEYPYKAIKQSRCMLMCSRFEGTPISILEALALGTPIVSTPVDGVNRIIEDGKTGFLSYNDDELVDSISNIIRFNKIKSTLEENCLVEFRRLNNTELFKSTLNAVYLSVGNGKKL